LGKQDVFASKYIYEKLTKCPNFTWYFPENYFPRFFVGGARAWCPLPLPHLLCLWKGGDKSRVANFQEMKFRTAPLDRDAVGVEGGGEWGGLSPPQPTRGSRGAS